MERSGVVICISSQDRSQRLSSFCLCEDGFGPAEDALRHDQLFLQSLCFSSVAFFCLPFLSVPLPLFLHSRRLPILLFPLLLTLLLLLLALLLSEHLFLFALLLFLLALLLSEHLFLLALLLSLLKESALFLLFLFPEDLQPSCCFLGFCVQLPFMLRGLHHLLPLGGFGLDFRQTL